MNPSLLLGFRILTCLICSWAVFSHEFPLDGTVLELDDSNFDLAISDFENVFVDFYAPWCGHCKRLSPELDRAALILFNSKEPIVVAKVNADKYSRLARKYEIDGFPTLKLFTRGVPEDYRGPRKSGPLVFHLKKFTAPDVSVLESDSAIAGFVESVGTQFPVFIGFGYDASALRNLSIKHKKKAWFAVANGYSEDAAADVYGFATVPALVSIHPGHDGRAAAFYGEGDTEEFVRNNLLPLVLRLDRETLLLLRDDDRKIVLTIVGDEADSAGLVGSLKEVAAADRDLVFAYVGTRQWPDFTDSFEVAARQLPAIFVWDGDEEYHSAHAGVVGNVSDGVRRLVEEYREGRTVKRRVHGVSFVGFVRSLVGIRTVYLLTFLIGIVVLIQSVTKEDEIIDPPRHGISAVPTDETTSSFDNKED